MSEILIILSGVPAGIWLYLLMFRGRFWLERPAVPVAIGDGRQPEVVAVIPARNEAGVVGEVVRALMAQEYNGSFTLVLVDDNSEDGTADEARAAADAARTEGSPHRFLLVAGRKLAPGWTGKLWAVNQGLGEAQRAAPGARYVLLTDADIRHGSGSLRQLVARAETGGFNLVSMMAQLKTATFAEKALIPAYIFFFQKLYPFAWVRDPKHNLGAAAGGCMLVRLKALKAAGGIAAIRGALIDDCALGRAIKRTGPTWLGLAGDVESLRGYPRWSDIWNLIARSAFTQLKHSSLLLLGSVLGMAFTYLLPPLITISADPGIRPLGIMAWAMMAFAYLPMLANYRRSPLWAPFLPLVALFYTAATIASAIRYWRGAGGQWKGRAQAEHVRRGAS
ncbi:hopene-associated glycosyltransferase HpnB [Dongia mobilis]|uniref:Hopene-associated glycosyltransferase HpnB n=1 Tax=Dongia mobilis TaxID=578943 RepID=A0A4R6WJ79_9PROT|nr:glycosyltransferase [Dongia mobilis]TDQ77734.1 hopene-associated glycosyltransferase HpnB [Dongia mobilis]